MRIINLLFLLNFLFLSACSQPEKKFLTWGKYLWEINVTYDSVDVERYDYITIDSVVTTKERVLKTTCSLTDSSNKYFRLSKTFIDTSFQIDPVTLEEMQVIEKFDSLPYNIDAGNIKLEDFQRTLIDSFSFSSSMTVSPDGLGVRVFSEDKFGPSRWYDAKKDFQKLGIRKGDHVIIHYYYYDPATKSGRRLGSVLFEII